ncbi:PP2C family protein-serine/threonine phosphatase [Streptomyces sp. NPDC049881]|uniref:PP2C family protein-serine/threonine phosphatase n=1 Tax=Streptomyces sp. NPDC049881 TaxID=3155778 RepID=UPI00341DC2E9
MDEPERMLDALTGILGEEHLVSFGDLPDLVARYAGQAGLDDTRLYLVDLRQQTLREVTGRGPDGAEGGDTFPVEGTLPGRVWASNQAQRGTEGERERWWVPVLDGTERLGVLRADVPPGTGSERVGVMASLVGLLVVSKRPSSDAAARLVRTETMNVAAEMQWNLMPPRSFANRDVVIAAAMEPAYEIGGDAFDYAVAGDEIHLAVFDAMGHDSRAGLVANLAVAAFRNQRRQGAGLVDTGERVERVLLDHFGHTTYITAVLAHLDTRSGMFSWINRGHHLPVLIRGARWTTSLRCPPAHPLGTELGMPARLCQEQLEPGDRVLLYTDGVIEARDARGREFGLNQFTDFVIRHHADGLPVPETLRRLMRAVLEHHSGRLDDDATVLCMEWHGPSRNTEMRPTAPTTGTHEA